MTEPTTRQADTTSTPATPAGRSLTDDEIAAIDRWWRAANYVSVGQIYLLDNPLLREPLRPEHVKPRLLGHWGTTPGLNLVYVHANRLIRERDLDAIFIAGPGHGGPAVVANGYLEGTQSEVYSSLTQDEDGLRALFRQFSFPGGVGSHATPEAPGSIHEGGELGYALTHAFGAVFDSPDLVVFAVVGDGEAETGPLATSWHSNKFLNPVTDGAVVPILHLNGYKIANPTVLARIPEDELIALFVGYGYEPILVSGDEPAVVHRLLAEAMDRVADRIAEIQAAARDGAEPATPNGTAADGAAVERPRWPMLILRTPKGWTGPKTVDGLPAEGSFRSHQVPLADVRQNATHLAQLEEWLRSYRPDELFDAAGTIRPEIAALAPRGDRRMSANPHANGGLLLRDLRLPDFRDYAVEVTSPAAGFAEATRVLGTFLRDVIAGNPDNFRIFGPDETASNRLTPVFDATNRAWDADILPTDDHLAPDGRVMEVLSEHLCEGWLEGYLLTGRHGLFNCYEAFIHIIDSMFNQHAKWLKMTREIPWRRPIASLNYLLSSHVWRQDHNGFSHQDPGFIDYVVNKKAEIIRVYLPPDANTLLSVADHCLRSRHYVNVVVAGKQPALTYLSMDDAILHATRGIGIWPWASNDGGDPDVVVAAAGDVPTLEALAAVALLRDHLPDLRIRFINVVDLMRLQDATEHPHGLSGRDFDALFTPDKPTIFAFHGYPWLIHRLTYRRTNHANLHVRGYKEEGTVTTPFDMVMRNDLDRYHLVMDVIDRVPTLGSHAAELRQEMVDRRTAARAWARTYGEDPAEIREWTWPH
ncbi:MAG TPA: phosphoketolase family protein [Candidatus Limnocylindrales bacterium]|nr:phosphoketolase family protein [Candidatus Limnocylindrales bacterium]